MNNNQKTAEDILTIIKIEKNFNKYLFTNMLNTIYEAYLQASGFGRIKVYVFLFESLALSNECFSRGFDKLICGIRY